MKIIDRSWRCSYAPQKLTKHLIGPKMVSNWSAWTLVNLHIPHAQLLYSVILHDCDFKIAGVESTLPTATPNLSMVKYSEIKMDCGVTKLQNWSKYLYYCLLYMYQWENNLLLITFGKYVFFKNPDRGLFILYQNVVYFIWSKTSFHFHFIIKRDYSLWWTELAAVIDQQYVKSWTIVVLAPLYITSIAWEIPCTLPRGGQVFKSCIRLGGRCNMHKWSTAIYLRLSHDMWWWIKFIFLIQFKLFCSLCIICISTVNTPDLIFYIREHMGGKCQKYSFNDWSAYIPS